MTIKAKISAPITLTLALIITEPTHAQESNQQQEFVELAPYMRELATLTHKLSLSITNNNVQLAKFYLYESLEILEDTKEDVPEYRGQPIALLIDRLLSPSYRSLENALKDADLNKHQAALTQLINSCNDCHTTTKHSFIKIIDRSDFNPFNQSFKP